MENDPVVVLFELLYGDNITRRLHTKRVQDLCLHLSSAPFPELEKLCDRLVKLLVAHTFEVLLSFYS